MKIEIWIDDVEQQRVAKKGNDNRQWLRIDANLWKRDPPSRRVVRFAPRFLVDYFHRFFEIGGRARRDAQIARGEGCV
jgi:hypothetical protein